MEFVWGLALEWSCRCSLHGESCARHVRNVLHIRNGLGFFLQVGLTRAILGLRPVSQRLRVAGNKNLVLRTLQSHLERVAGSCSATVVVSVPTVVDCVPTVVA